jgi:protein-tyrosine phosphatase
MDVTVASVEVDTLPGEGLLVRWTLVGGHETAPGEAPHTAVDIGVGPTPDHIDHVHVWRSAPTDREAHLRGLGPGRHYVSVSPAAGGSAVVAAERRVPFEGVRNFRDLGGYVSRLGGRTRWGQVFRADALEQLTITDLAAYEQLGLRVVFDLRGDRERIEAPDPFASRHLPLSQPHDERPDVSAIQTAAEGERRLHDQYLEIVDTMAPSLGDLLAGLTDPGGLPAVFHCAGGKDRTGIAAALLLGVLGVDRETVLDDYELTGRWRTPEHEPELVAQLLDLGFGRAAIESLLGSPRPVMAATLDHLDQEHGGIERYLLGPAGLAGEVIDELRQRLLVADGDGRARPDER